MDAPVAIAVSPARGPVEALTTQDHPNPTVSRCTTLRAALEQAVEQAIDALNALDNDPDFEPSCEDEGAQCEDDGWDSDSEPHDHHAHQPTYGADQRCIEASVVGITLSERVPAWR